MRLRFKSFRLSNCHFQLPLDELTDLLRRTLCAWKANFDKNWPKLQGKYDERFRRMWTFYLCSGAAAFKKRKLNLWQIVLSKKGLDGGFAGHRWKFSAKFGIRNSMDPNGHWQHEESLNQRFELAQDLLFKVTHFPIHSAYPFINHQLWSTIHQRRFIVEHSNSQVTDNRLNVNPHNTQDQNSFLYKMQPFNDETFENWLSRYIDK